MAGYGGPWMGSPGGGGGGPIMDTGGGGGGGGSGAHVPHCCILRDRGGGGAVGNACRNGCCSVQYGCTTFSSKGFADIEGFLGSLRRFLEDGDVQVSVTVHGTGPLPNRVVWDFHRCCRTPCQGMNFETAARISGSYGGG